ncbi:MULTISPECIES: hypothetical protein [unclassified Raoultella]|uniref:hypothetical protein n=1 Tax=unclassified Raoultella TaxID=2627600 RepID=UPI00135A1845|nr:MULTISPECIES: hypothetical protein [unclassified Raoultella]
MSEMKSYERAPGQGMALSNAMGWFDVERHKRWIMASFGMMKFNQWAMITVQGLGALDARLIKDDEGVVSTGHPNNPFQDLGDHIFISQLWVMGTYELIRTMSQDARKDASQLRPFLCEINTLKNKINRLRIPLAKMEASERNHNDSPIATPGYNIKDGISWQLNYDFWITRKELSDETLTLLELISKN